MRPADVGALLEAVGAGWVDDEQSDVVWAGEFEGRFGVRMAQQVRDYTTVWFDVGERTLGYEAYVLPNPPGDKGEVYRQCLLRNLGHWRAHFAIAQSGDVYLRGRMPLSEVSQETLDAVLGAIYEQVEVGFSGLVRAGFERREKTL